jgi:bacterioferritin
MAAQGEAHLAVQAGATRYWPEEIGGGAFWSPTLRPQPNLVVTARDLPQADTITRLNEALVNEVACAVGYKRHQVMADMLARPGRAIMFLGYAGEALAHANRLAGRIEQLGGIPVIDPDLLADCVPVPADNLPTVRAMLAADIASEQAAIDSYCRLLMNVAAEDSVTRILVEDILADALAHPEELRSWLDS